MEADGVHVRARMATVVVVGPLACYLAGGGLAFRQTRVLPAMPNLGLVCARLLGSSPLG